VLPRLDSSTLLTCQALPDSSTVTLYWPFSVAVGWVEVTFWLIVTRNVIDTGLVTASYLKVLEGDYDTSGVAGPRTQDKQVSAGSGTIDSITSFGTGPVSITFLVTINQKVTSTQSPATLNGQYSVTVAASGSAWQVNNLQLSTLGNTGSTGSQ
jgi:hypothetical protein